MARQAGAVVGMLFLAHAAVAQVQFIQQGNKLVGTDASWYAGQGTSVAISANGNTAIVGGPDYNCYHCFGVGAAWVFTRNGGVWTQQGSKLVANDSVRESDQGTSVAISADGNTAIVGGPHDQTIYIGFGAYTGLGAAWAFTLTGGVWTQQGIKLVGNDSVGVPSWGASATISADGNTTIVGGPGDNSFAGAAWVFVRSSDGWTQQGGKLVGADGSWYAGQGTSVAISTDGNTAVVGGSSDNSGAGAVWVFTRSGGVWAQQGGKLVGTGAIGPAEQGNSVAISADGNTAIVGGYQDNSGAGAVWLFTRSGGVWTQQGSKLVGVGAVGPAWQGNSVAISADGNAAIVGAPLDNSNAGAVWVYTRNNGAWSQQGGKLVGTGAVGPARQGKSVAISGDSTTVIVGGDGDAGGIGAVWVFAANGCDAPSITGQPQSQIVQGGQTATLSVTATATMPLSYRWYRGNAGDTSTPVGANASTFTTPPLESTTSYWVWVFNACGTTDSATATISVEPRVRRHLQRAM